MGHGGRKRKIKTDTYEREIERYGHITMIASENIFCSDSCMAVDFIELINGSEGEELRWLFSLRAMDNYLNTFKYTDEEKLRFMENLKLGFGKEFGMSRFLKKQLDDKYRANRKKIEEFMLFQEAGKPEYAPILKLLSKKMIADYHASTEILGLRDEGKLGLELNYLMGSYIHMLMNRLFKTKNRMHELVCYDFLFRYYKSMIARQKYANN